MKYSALLWLVYICVSIYHGNARRPNIIFVLVDDVGLGDTSVKAFRLGKKSNAKYSLHTPNLEKLAADGVALTQAYSEPVCTPARFALLTGLSSGHSPLRGNTGTRTDMELPQKLSTLPRLLQKQGYHTMLTGKWGFSSDPVEFGFDTFYGLRGHVESHSCFPAYVYENSKKVSTMPPGVRNGLGYESLNNLNKCSIDAIGDKSECKFFHDLVTERSLKNIDLAVQRKQPFYLNIAYTAPHACSWTDTMDGTFPLYMVAPFNDFENCPLYEGEIKNKPRRSEGYIRALNECRYWSLIKNYMDRDIGRLVDKTKRLGIENNTIFVFSSDNGPSDLDGIHSTHTFDSTAGFLGGKRTVTEGGIRVPIIIKWPNKIRAGGVHNIPMMLSDLSPTFLQAASLSLHGSLSTRFNKDSISVLPKLVGNNQKQRKRRYMYIEYCDKQHLKWEQIKRKKAAHCSYMFREGSNKLIYSHETRQFHLFDLKKDPYEKHDLLKKKKNKRNRSKVRLAKRLKRKRKKYGAHISLVRAGFDGTNVLKPLPDLLL
uniref:Sulfatase N-terminal domain-containing protein n=1 Tax=Mucochytrium quahogii TaxID=96639 RepID=A0A7S2R732_9STRA|mmetsp:Transcript_29586/g.47271  ORF Transcript_29586/g.47271 Transcript_29586/m.47271 type:complete len:541 (-) Transcript_29586:337-1959(-)|eukprot:CAMPEP_0203754022 /NCGR_PEP_ID=MMETSP0098-20131031/7688_1 /ASSEMBLY_ACC=CAM_ASM_000208 /TAXON_ID=96639 /ORGANISM=" , Strain NY0313808BC1" /LENGTH=540 /DNA_ID=CAMNT_0050644865 /DNA_START=1617 /DNA_END=3239 /DNA_ORIENTATION=-